MSLKNHPLLPEDATPEEEEFWEFSIVSLYRSLERKEDMFLVAFCFDLGYKKTMAAQILGLSPASITSRIERLKNDLKKNYTKKKVTD